MRAGAFRWAPPAPPRRAPRPNPNSARRRDPPAGQKNDTQKKEDSVLGGGRCSGSRARGNRPFSLTGGVSASAGAGARGRQRATTGGAGRRPDAALHTRGVAVPIAVPPAWSAGAVVRVPHVVPPRANRRGVQRCRAADGAANRGHISKRAAIRWGVATATRAVQTCPRGPGRPFLGGRSAKWQKWTEFPQACCGSTCTPRHSRADWMGQCASYVFFCLFFFLNR